MLGLNLVVLRSADIEAARAFYEALGAVFEKHAHGKGPEHYAHEDESGVFEIYPVAAGASPDTAGLGFGSSDLNGVAERLREAGAEPGAVADQPWGRSFVVRDPDGRRVEVKETS